MCFFAIFAPSVRTCYLNVSDNLHLILAYLFALVLEVYQFARDAAVAEAWLIAQEPYLMSQELGVSSYPWTQILN